MVRTRKRRRFSDAYAASAPGFLACSARRAVRVARAISTDAPASAHAASATKGSGASATVPTFRAILRLSSTGPTRLRPLAAAQHRSRRGTMNPATFLRSSARALGVCYPEPPSAPTGSRSGDNPNRVQRHTQFQMISAGPGNAQELCLGSLEALESTPRRTT